MSRLHPFTLLALAAALPVLAWLFPSPVGPAAALAVAAGLAALAPSPWSRVLRPALVAAAPFWLFLFLLHDRATALAIALRLSTMIAAFFWLVAILPTGRLVEGMVAAGWPVQAAFLFAATLSAVPALRERGRRIVEAQRCRGLHVRGGPRARLHALRALALPLVLSAIHEVDERALALETRGLGSAARRTPLDPPRDWLVERVARWLLLGACLTLVLWRLA